MPTTLAHAFEGKSQNYVAFNSNPNKKWENIIAAVDAIHPRLAGHLPVRLLPRLLRRLVATRLGPRLRLPRVVLVADQSAANQNVASPSVAAAAKRAKRVARTVVASLGYLAAVEYTAFLAGSTAVMVSPRMLDRGEAMAAHAVTDAVAVVAK